MNRDEIKTVNHDPRDPELVALERDRDELSAALQRSREILTRYRNILTRVVLPSPLGTQLSKATDEQLEAAGLSADDICALRDSLSAIHNFSWLRPGILAGAARPHSPQAVAALCEAGVQCVLTLTEEPLTAEWLEGQQLTVEHLPMADFESPDLAQLIRAVNLILAHVAKGDAVVVHCAAGIGRIGTVLAGYLIHEGATPDEAVAEVRRIRGRSVESSAQIATLHAYAAYLSGTRASGTSSS